MRPQQIKGALRVYINCLIENPAFTSQTKEQLTTRVSKFGSRCDLSAKFLKKVVDCTPFVSFTLFLFIIILFFCFFLFGLVVDWSLL